MKLLYIAILLLFIVPQANSAECVGHIFFYNHIEGIGETETNADYAFYYYKIIEKLPLQNISFSKHLELPIEAKTCFSKKIKLDSEQLKSSLGYVLMKPNNETMVIGGVYTDIDLDNAISDFFIKKIK